MSASDSSETNLFSDNKHGAARSNNSDEILAIGSIRQKCFPIFQKYGIKQAWVFGSYCRGEASKTSDIDLIVKNSPNGLMDSVDFRDTILQVLNKEVDILSFVELMTSEILDYNSISKEWISIYEVR